MSFKTAIQSDWKTTPMPERHEDVGLRHPFTDEQMSLICRGLIPEEMEDKWFIYFEDDRLFFHRSWTGMCVFVVHFEKNGDGWVANRVQVNAEPDEYGDPDLGRDVPMVVYMIRVLLLGEDLEFSFEGFVEMWQVMGRGGFGG